MARRSTRTARLGELLREILATELSRMDDERLELTSITGVDTDADLSWANVYLNVLDETELETVLEACEEHRPQLKRAIARRARLRRVPELRFALDPSIGSGQRVEQILRRIGDEQQ